MNDKTAIQSAKLRQLLSVSKVSLIASISLALFLAYMQQAVVSSASFIVWGSLMVLASLLRAALVYAPKHFDVDYDANVHLWKFRLGVIVAGAVWGSAGFLLYPDNHPQHVMFLIFVLGGMTVGGVASFSADLISAVSFSVLLCLPITVRLFVAGDGLSASMGMAVLLYLGFMIMILRRISRNVYENISLRLEAAAREEKVREGKERYRLLLAHLPVGIFHFDTDLVITYCNERLAAMLRSSVERLIGLDMKLLKEQAILPSLRKALQGEMGYFEGHYLATHSEADGWAYITCAPFHDGSGAITGGIAIVQDISERKLAEDKIKNLAFYDPLTELPNRRLLLERLHHALASSARSNKEGALLFIDLDNFKALNDTLGHDMGDLLLRQVAQRLNSCVHADDTVARLGGDEFVVMLEDLGGHGLEAAAQTEAIGERILDALGRPYQLVAHEYRCTPSIGATLFCGHRLEKEELLKQADIAMYQAKKAGRNTVRFFDQLMQDAVTARVVLEGELRGALVKRQFHLYYQIQVDQMRRPLGAEALIRWIHPERGLISPDLFIKLAEETDLILSIGHWVIDAACAQIKAWQQNVLTRNLALAVNVSARQFRQADFTAQVQAAVQRHAISPVLLKLELTESMLLDNIEETIKTMQALKEIGVQFSLDDFGTGYSSLQYLKRLPLDQIKIDRSFVRDIAADTSDREIVGTIIAMAQNLYLDVIAEGVETEVQRQFLLGNGCTQFQGGLFGNPVPLEQFEAMLKQE
ncbi:MAG: EAL domain-containing protein [Sideroxydans sp.]|nr:EAL domain-containing protein [Sideroxydans sp.]